MTGRTGRRRRRRLLAGVVATGVLTTTAACGGSIPRDTDGSLDRITGGALRVGVTENPPWTEVDDDGRVAGREVDLVTDFAEELDARVEWTPGVESELVRSMERGDLDVLIGGLTSESPWEKDVALTRSYAQQTTPDGESRERVMATPLGENGLLVALESFLANTGEAS